MPKDFTVAFTALTDGDTLGCSKQVNVSWEKPNAVDQARLRLFCNCSQHAGAEVAHHDTPATADTGNHTFTLTHTSTINETGRRLDVTIENNGVEKNNDVRTSMTVQCPDIP